MSYRKRKPGPQFEIAIKWLMALQNERLEQITERLNALSSKSPAKTASRRGAA